MGRACVQTLWMCLHIPIFMKRVRKMLVLTWWRSGQEQIKYIVGNPLIFQMITLLLHFKKEKLNSALESALKRRKPSREMVISVPYSRCCLDLTSWWQKEVCPWGLMKTPLWMNPISLPVEGDPKRYLRRSGAKSSSSPLGEKYSCLQAQPWGARLDSNPRETLLDRRERDSGLY